MRFCLGGVEPFDNSPGVTYMVVAGGKKQDSESSLQSTDSGVQIVIMIDFVLVFALVCIAVVIVFPRHGLVSKWREVRARVQRVQQEDALKFLLKSKASKVTPTADGVAQALNISSAKASRLLSEMKKMGLISDESGRLALRDIGREIALHVVRAHRLWESYLAEQTGVPKERWHAEADKREHFLSEKEADALSAQLGDPIVDPHGDVIPEAGGQLESEPGLPLSAAELRVPLEISHIEDEPGAVYAQLVAQGLHPGMKVSLSEKNAERVRFIADGKEQVLAPLLAGSITVRPLTDTEISEEPESKPLSELKAGETGRIVGLSPACRGAERRRLLDFGFVPGTDVSVELVGPGGNPIAYRVRGGVVALRREQARSIRVQSLKKAAA